MHLGLCSFDAADGGARETARRVIRPRACHVPDPGGLVATDADPGRFADLPPAFHPGLPLARPIAPPEGGDAWHRGS